MNYKIYVGDLDEGLLELMQEKGWANVPLDLDCILDKNKYGRGPDLIFAPHVLCLFDVQTAMRALFVWRMSLVHGGILRLSVPDFEALLHVYAETGGSLGSIIEGLYGYGKYGSSPYKMAYDFPSLVLMLKAAGFRNVHKWHWQETDHSHIRDLSQSYFPDGDVKDGLLISLNVECEL